ncbi:MAG: site-specific DNA-methyltransferase [Planctomycetota bacterium]
MPNLTWIGKEAVVRHHLDVPFRLLKAQPKLSFGDPGSGNLIVQGDNLVALKALLPYYAGAVKCIYIDPPYNTGNENWVYNDNVNSPEIRAWLGEVVGKEAEDLTRHEKWLCMMYPRLRLLRDFLRPDGAIFVSIDSNEMAALKLLMDEVFGPKNFIAELIWKRRVTPDSRNLNGVSGDHEYVLCYGASPTVRFKGQLKDLEKYKNPDGDPNGAWMSDNLTGLANAQERPNLHYDIVNPLTGKKYPPSPSRGWIFGPEKMKDLIARGRILWPNKPKGRPRLKRYLSDMKSERTGFSTMLKAPANVDGTKELASILGPKAFAFPKPTGLIATLIDQIADRDSIVLDSFAGSGTTGQAVLQLNARDGGTRKFILVELEAEVAQNVTAVRLSRVSGEATAESGAADEPNRGFKGSFQYCTIGPEMFDHSGQITPHVGFDDLARHLFFVETGTALAKPKLRSPLVGVHGDTGYYLLFNGVLGDRRRDGGNVLTGKILEAIPPHDGPKVIYGEGCRLSPSRLQREGILFKQIPYQIRTR